LKKNILCENDENSPQKQSLPGTCLHVYIDLINIFTFVMVNKIDRYISQVRVVNLGPFWVNVRYIGGRTG
jgi:hypothetical protein